MVEPEQVAGIVKSLTKAQRENWLPVEGFDHYEVSDLGRIRSLDRVIHTKDGRAWKQSGRILSQGLTRKGYPSIKLYKGNFGYPREVHRLICIAFHGPANGRQVCHKNGTPTDNRAENLRWGTISENAMDKAEHGTMLRGTQLASSKLTADQAVAIYRRVMGGERKTDLAREFGVCEKAVRKIATGETWADATLAVRSALAKENDRGKWKP